MKKKKTPRAKKPASKVKRVVKLKKPAEVEIKKGEPIFKDAKVPDGIDPLLTPHQVRISLGYENKRKVFDMIHNKTLEAVNLKEPNQKKNQWRVRRSELQRYINSL